MIVFFGDGTVRGFAAPRVAFGEAVTATSTLQPSLPDQTLPLRVASDAKLERLFALTTADVAMKLTRRRAAAAAATKDDDAPLHFGERRDGTGPRVDVRPRNIGETRDLRNETGHESPVDAKRDSKSPVTLRFEGGAWTFDRTAPEELYDAQQVLAFWAAPGGSRILFRPQEDSAIAEVRRSDQSDAGWVAGMPFPIGLDVKQIAAGFDEEGEEDVIAVVEAATGREVGAQHVRVWRSGGREWRSKGVLTLRSGEVASFAKPPALAVSGRNVFTSAPDSADAAAITVWSSVDGVETGSIDVKSGLISPTAPTLNPIARHALQYAALAVVLTSVFVWRRERLTEAVVLQPGQMPASVQRRVLAFVIDFIVLSPVALPTLWSLWGVTMDGPVSWEELLRAAEATSSPLFWTGSVFGAEFGVYAAVCEWLMGATAGKRICGCRVVGEGGEPCRFRDIVIRNAVRVVEFHFTASFLVTLLTPGRQRLGDLLARTLVVERCEIEPPAPEETGDARE